MIARTVSALLVGALWLAPQAALARCDNARFAPLGPLPADHELRLSALSESDPTLDNPARLKAWQALIAEAGKAAKPDTRLIALANARASLDSGDTGREKLALELAEAGLAAAALSGDTRSGWRSEVQAALAVAWLNAGKAAEGMLSAQTALDLAKGTDSAEAALANGAMGYALFGRGRYADSEPYWREAARLAVKCFPADSGQTLSMLGGIGAAQAMAGDFEAGTQSAIKALNWGTANLRPDHPELSSAYQNLAADFSFFKQFAQAEPLYRAAIDLKARTAPEHYDSRALQLANFGDNLDMQGKHEEAEAAFRQSRAFYLKSNNRLQPFTRVLPVMRMANAAVRAGNLPKALDLYQAATTEAEGLVAADDPQLNELKLQYALALKSAKRFQEAWDIARPAMAAYRSKTNSASPRRMTAEFWYADIASHAGNAEAGYQVAAPVAKALELRLLGTANRQADLIRSAPLFQISFATMTRLALETGRHDEALRTLQLANLSNIVVVNSNVAVRAAVSDPLAKAALQRLETAVAARQKLDRQRLDALAAKNAAEVGRIEGAARDADGAIAAASGELDRVFPLFRELARPIPVSLYDLRARLGKDQIVLAPLPAQGLTVVVTREGLSWAPSSGGNVEVAGLVSRLRASIEQAQRDPDAPAGFDAEAAARLYDIVVPEPLRKVVRQHRDVLFYATGPLASIPPGMLLTSPMRGASLAKAPWFIRDHAVTILPSLAPRRLRAETGSRTAAFLGLGAPLAHAAPQGSELRGDGIDGLALSALPALPQAERELRALQALVGGADSKVLTGSALTQDRLQALNLSRYSVIAFATHGLAGGDFAGVNEPALVLSPGSDGDPGLLTASEIAGLQLDSDWVILSACNTAAGQGAGMPAYDGLASAFMQAGARALLVSHWPLRDDAAARLTRDTMTQVSRGIPRAEALRRAMVGLLSDRKLDGAANPAVWAPFVLLER